LNEVSGANKISIIVTRPNPENKRTPKAIQVSDNREALHLKRTIWAWLMQYFSGSRGR